GRAPARDVWISATHDCAGVVFNSSSAARGLSARASRSSIDCVALEKYPILVNLHAVKPLRTVGEQVKELVGSQRGFGGIVRQPLPASLDQVGPAFDFVAYTGFGRELEPLNSPARQEAEAGLRPDGPRRIHG